MILKTLSRHLKDDTAPDGFGPDQIRSEYLVNPFGKGDQRYRLVLKAGDVVRRVDCAPIGTISY